MAAGLPALREALLGWFSRHQRDLPWRRTRDPYAIWISEVMLQQTQVQTVIPYWTRFLERFPTVEALAAADLDAVLSAWRGLGYYGRARLLHAAARVIVAEHGGHLPSSAARLRELPGFGRYTAGAVASIAFGEAAPLVDGNVARVLSRTFLVEGAAGDLAREARLWRLAEALVAGDRPGDFNQALMELGALVCRPEAPGCLLCPWREHCGALAQGRIAELPPPKVRAARKALELCVAVWWRGDRLLFARRSGGGLFGGLWELPSVEGGPQALSGRLGKDVRCGEPLGELRRTLTHRELTLRLVRAGGPRAPRAVAGYDELRWATVEEAAALGMSTAMAKALALAVQAKVPVKRGSASPPPGKPAPRRSASAARAAPPAAARRSARRR